MANEASTTAPAVPPLPPPTIHEAELASGPPGAVLRGAELTFEGAVARRRTGMDVVVGGDDLAANRALAAAIEAAVGPRSKPQKPHKKAGPFALPHFHQVSRAPDGQCFYETENPRKKARSKR